MIRKNIYKWHRICSLIIAVPVLLWAFSGFMHPIMTNLRPAMKTQQIPVKPIDSTRIKLTLQEVLKQNKIDSIYSVRLVHIDTNWFYQVKTSRKYNLQYISAKNGKILVKGDWLYAQYIARIFLEGSSKKAERPAEMQMHQVSDMADCCGEAASTILNSKTGAPIEGASLISQFDEEYKSIYCLLPVYKVLFKRDDNIRLYVETGQDRFAVAVDKKRAVFTKFFDLVHTWSWIDFLSPARILVLIFFSGLGFITAVMGIYIFFSTKSKQVKGNAILKARRNHRYTAIIAAIFTLMFTFSGCYHLFSKLGDEGKELRSVQQSFASSAVGLDLSKLHRVVKKNIVNIGLIRLDGKTYWQAFLQGGKKSHNSKDLMKDRSVDAEAVVYVNAADYSVLPNGDELYARDLARQLSGTDPDKIVSAELITGFTNEYNFTDKRLPVWKVNYPFNHKERLYIETSTGILAKNTNDVALYEGYSFALFHKHHYMDFLGKITRDISTMAGALLQIIMVTVGFIFYFKWRNKKYSLSNRDMR